MAQDLSFSGSSVRAGVGSMLGAVSIALAGCGPQSGSEPPQALSDVQRELCRKESIAEANDILAARNAQSGKGFVNKIYTPKDTPTDQDVFLGLQQKAQAKCEQETRAGQRKHAEDRGTVYPAFGTAAQAEAPAPAASAPEVPVVPAPAPVAPAPAASAPVPAPAAPAPKELPPEAGVAPEKGEKLEPAASAASAPAAGASAPEAAASAVAKQENWARRWSNRVIGSSGSPDNAASSPTR